MSTRSTIAFTKKCHLYSECNSQKVFLEREEHGANYEENVYITSDEEFNEWRAQIISEYLFYEKSRNPKLEERIKDLTEEYKNKQLQIKESLAWLNE